MKHAWLRNSEMVVQTQLLKDVLQLTKDLWDDLEGKQYKYGDEDTMDAITLLLNPPEEEDVDNICTNCSGCGEGTYEGSKCFTCKGHGVINS